MTSPNGSPTTPAGSTAPGAPTAPTATVLPLRNVMRPDVVQPSLSREAALQNAPDPENGFFKVPKIVE